MRLITISDKMKANSGLVTTGTSIPLALSIEEKKSDPDFFKFSEEKTAVSR
jgi:hypothetical protein